MEIAALKDSQQRIEDDVEGRVGNVSQVVHYDAVQHSILSWLRLKEPHFRRKLLAASLLHEPLCVDMPSLSLISICLIHIKEPHFPIY